MSVKPGLYVVTIPGNGRVWVQVVQSHEREELEASPTSRVSLVTLKEEFLEEEASPSSREELAKTA